MAGFCNIGWTIGNHCNANCGHCYSAKVRKGNQASLTRCDVDRIVAQLARLGVRAVNLGGNEPIYTHGPDPRQSILPYVIRALTEAGILVGFTTNGTTFAYLDKRHPDELRMVNDVDFSLDSPFAEEHDGNRRAPLFGTVVRGIERARELSIGCSVVACGMRTTFTPEYLSAFLALTQLLGCEFRINTLKPVEPALLPEMPSAQQFYDGFAFLMGNTHCISQCEACLTAFTGVGTAGCPCGSTSFRINAKTADGRVPLSPCVYIHDLRSGDLLSEDVFDIVSSDRFGVVAKRRHDVPAKCHELGCALLEQCRGGCAARTYFVYGTMDAPDPYCPLEYLRLHGTAPDLPERPPIGCGDGMRVHDEYLCTWIGEATPAFADPRFTTMERFLGQAPEFEDGDNGHRRYAPPLTRQSALVGAGTVTRP